jgi:tetratricopeptide (TPR) repeat protein
MGRQFTIIPTTDENVPSNGISFDGSFLGMDPGMQQELQNIFLHSEEATKQHDPHDHQIKDAFDIVLGHLAQMGDEIPNELWLALQSKILDKRIVSKVDTVLSRAETFGIVSLSNTHIRFAQTSFAAALRKEFEKRPNAKASHRLIADGMEDFFERPNREQIKVIAQQRHLSDEPEAAVRLLQGAGEAAFQEFDLDAAREYFLQVQKLVDLESDEDQRISNTIDAQSIWMRLGEVHGALGEHGAAEDALSRVIATTSGGEIEARSYKLLGDLAMSQERYQDAIAYFDRARSAYTDLGTHSQAVALTGEMGRCLFFSGQTDEAERLIQEALNVGLKLENKDSSLLPTLYGNLGAIASSTSRLHEAREHHREEVRLAELADRQSILSTGLISLAKVAYAQCDFNSAEKASARAFEIGKTTPEGPGHHCIIWRTKVMAAQGMLREALSVLEDALDQSTASGDRANTAELLLCLGDISLASNRNTVATAHYEKVVEISDAVGFANLWMTAKIRLSYVALHQGNEPGIYAHLGAVMQRAQEHHDRPGELAVRAHIIYLQLLQHGFKAKGDTFSSLLHIDEATPLMEANIIAMLFKADDVTAKGDFENAQALLERTRSGASRIGDLGMMIMIQRRKRLVDAHQGKTTTTQAVDGYAVGAILPPEVGIRRFTSLPKSA